MSNALSHLTIRARLTTMMAVVVIGFVCFAVLAYSVLGRVKVNGPVYSHIVRGKDLVADVLPPPEYIIESYLIAFQETQRNKPRGACQTDCSWTGAEEGVR